MNTIPLTKEVKKLLRPALKSAAKAVFNEVEQGQAMLVQTENKKLVAILRGEARTLVIVAVAGSDLFQTRQEFIDLAKAQEFTVIRFHTTHPERLKKGLRGLPVKLVEVRPRLFGKDEHVYKLVVM